MLKKHALSDAEGPPATFSSVLSLNVLIRTRRVLASCGLACGEKLVLACWIRTGKRRRIFEQHPAWWMTANKQVERNRYDLKSWVFPNLAKSGLEETLLPGTVF